MIVLGIFAVVCGILSLKPGDYKQWQEQQEKYWNGNR